MVRQKFILDRYQLRVAMAYKSINMSELSELCGISRQTLYNAASNKVGVSPKTLGKIANALEVEIEELLM